MHAPVGGSLPGAIWIASREHFDSFSDMPEHLAADFGRVVARAERAILSLGDVGRVHLYRWGDGGAHFHVWMLPRPLGMTRGARDDAAAVGGRAAERERRRARGGGESRRSRNVTVHDSLARRLGTKDAVVVGLGSMIGAGVFSAFAPAAAAAGSGLLIGLALAAGVAYCNAVASAQLAAQYPTSGGTYVYGRERLGEWWGFVAGWGFVIGKTASCAAMALTFASYAVGGSMWEQRAVARRRGGRADCRELPRDHAHGRARPRARRGVARSRSSSWSARSRRRAGSTRARCRTCRSGTAASTGSLQSAGLLFFAFAGYARIATLGEEVRDPERTIPRAIPIALGIAVVIYAVVGVSLLACRRAGCARREHGTGRHCARSCGRRLGRPRSHGSGAAVASLGALLALIAGVGRTALAMARNSDLPQWLASVHPRYRVPDHAELALGIVVALLVLTTDLRGAIGFSSFGVLVYYAVANASAYTQIGGPPPLAARAERRGPRRAASRSWSRFRGARSPPAPPSLRSASRAARSSRAVGNQVRVVNLVHEFRTAAALRGNS